MTNKTQEKLKSMFDHFFLYHAQRTGDYGYSCDLALEESFLMLRGRKMGKYLTDSEYKTIINQRKF